MTKNSKYPYIGYCSTYYTYAIFYRKDYGIILNEGCSWLKRGSIVKEHGFTVENQKNINKGGTT